MAAAGGMSPTQEHPCISADRSQGGLTRRSVSLRGFFRARMRRAEGSRPHPPAGGPAAFSISTSETKVLKAKATDKHYTFSGALPPASGRALVAHSGIPRTPKELSPGMSDHKPLPVKGYSSQSELTINLVNEIKVHEEKMLQCMDKLQADPAVDQRWLAIARTDMQKAYMALVRSIFKPERIELLPDKD